MRSDEPDARPSRDTDDLLRQRASHKKLSFDDDGRPVLITAAAVSVEDQHRARVRRYLTLMAFRIPALVGAAVAYGVWHNGWISLVILAASIPLPWMAVLIANDRPARRAEEPRRYGPQPRRQALFPTADHRALDAAPSPQPHAPPGDSD